MSHWMVLHKAIITPFILMPSVFPFLCLFLFGCFFVVLISIKVKLWKQRLAISVVVSLLVYLWPLLLAAFLFTSMKCTLIPHFSLSALWPAHTITMFTYIIISIAVTKTEHLNLQIIKLSENFILLQRTLIEKKKDNNYNEVDYL